MPTSSFREPPPSPAGPTAAATLRTSSKRARVDDADDSDVSEDELRGRRLKAIMSPSGTRIPTSHGSPRSSKTTKAQGHGTPLSAAASGPLPQTQASKLSRQHATTGWVFDSEVSGSASKAGGGGTSKSQEADRISGPNATTSLPTPSSTPATPVPTPDAGAFSPKAPKSTEKDVVWDPSFSPPSMVVPADNCVVQVDKTLFCIHRNLLGLVASVDHKGPWDLKNPLVLSGLNPDEFHSFCWIHYLTPEVVTTHKPATGVIKADWVSLLLPLVSLCWRNKNFDIPAIKEWAQKSLRVAANAPDAQSELFTTGPPSVLAQLLDILITNGFDEEIRPLEQRWIQALLRRGQPCLVALNAAEKNNMQELRGVAYYLQVQAMNASDDKDSRETNSPTSLTPAQQRRVMTGYVSLVRWWDTQKRQPRQLPASAPKHRDSDRGAGADMICCPWAIHERCVSRWEGHWREALSSDPVLSLSSCDVLRLLDALGEEIGKRKPQNLCWWLGLEDLQRFTEDVRKQMMTLFFGGKDD